LNRGYPQSLSEKAMVDPKNYVSDTDKHGWT
jgi:hypothetical protein